MARICYEARVAAVLAARQPKSFVTSREPELAIELGGIPGDRHYGLFRKADSRQSFYPRGTLIANRRQISIVSLEECDLIAGAMGIPEVRPEWLGANLLLEGYPQLTSLPVGSRLLFPEACGLIGEGENPPCKGPGKEIAEALQLPELAGRFVKAAKHRRGIVCSVEREGRIHEGDTVRIFLP
ncbi:MOSC domain-containing protein [Paenibacillus caseinilyticus]|uniref:Molybdenum cofactor sulfurase n=1 Tax=Paenibacillus mucilaginosus K02 TaxID=997761 RepID=I0BB15_9BACL|nr:MOSC domain-containing protein [Paenibacillus mucilaginosus]AFH59562.1 molybdenum cofactor sulfurase [Paenibacillus mucilaginosus K02]